jgi:hypothetical protein
MKSRMSPALHPGDARYARAGIVRLRDSSLQPYQESRYRQASSRANPGLTGADIMRSILLWAALLMGTTIFAVAVPVEAAAQGAGYCMCRSKKNPHIASCKSRKFCVGGQYCSGYCLRRR